jgi:hypothetical protein
LLKFKGSDVVLNNAADADKLVDFIAEPGRHKGAVADLHVGVSRLEVSEGTKFSSSNTTILEEGVKELQR